MMDALAPVLRAAQALHEAVPACAHLAAETAQPAPVAADFLRAVKTAAPHAQWRRSYDPYQVRAAFTERYGWFEIAGPSGHSHSDLLRVCFGYWGLNLTYPLHSHAAEEVYYVVAGRAAFWTDTTAPLWRGPGAAQAHTRSQPHGFSTGEVGLCTLILWRGPGMGDRATLTETEPATGALT